MTLETQASIEAWAAETFAGTDRSPLGILTRMNIEVAELQLELCEPRVGEWRDAIGLECADIWIVLAQAAHHLGFDLEFSDPDELVAKQRTCAELGGLICVESAELISAVQHDGNRSAIANHVQMISLLCSTLSQKYSGGLLQDYVQRKMQVNRKRQWKRTPAGRMQHA